MDKRIKKKGFTLAELLVVVAILAVLVAVSIPIFTGQLGKAKDTVCKNNIETIRHLYVMETLQNGAPTDEAGAQDILAKAITQADDGDYHAGTNTYEAACGGTCTATFSVDGMSIVKIECDTHGKGNGAATKVYTTEELLEGLKDVMEKAGYDGTINITHIYSGVPDEQYDNFFNNIPDDMKEALEGKSYVVKSPRNTFSDYEIVLYDGVLNGLKSGDKVDVSIINKEGNKSTGEKYIGTTTYNGKSYNIIGDY